MQAFIMMLSFLFARIEMMPIDPVTLKLPLTINPGIDIIIEGELHSKQDTFSLTFSGEKMSVQDEWHIKYIPEKNEFCLIQKGVMKTIFSPRFDAERFLIRFNARNETANDFNDQVFVMEIFYGETKDDIQPSEVFINTTTIHLVEHIKVNKGFSNISNVTFSFNR